MTNQTQNPCTACAPDPKSHPNTDAALMELKRHYQVMADQLNNCNDPKSYGSVEARYVAAGNALATSLATTPEGLLVKVRFLEEMLGEVLGTWSQDSFRTLIESLEGMSGTSPGEAATVHPTSPSGNLYPLWQSAGAPDPIIELGRRRKAISIAADVQRSALPSLPSDANFDKDAGKLDHLLDCDNALREAILHLPTTSLEGAFVQLLAVFDRVDCIDDLDPQRVRESKEIGGVALQSALNLLEQAGGFRREHYGNCRGTKREDDPHCGWRGPEMVMATMSDAPAAPAPGGSTS